MSSIRGSKSVTPNDRLKVSSRKPGEDNLKWLARHWPSNDDKLLLLLVGGATPLHFRLRIAQCALRHDLSPSHWSHVALVAPGKKGRHRLWESSLEPPGGFGYLPKTNALHSGTLNSFKDPARFPNIALLTTTANHAQVLSAERISSFRNQRAVLNAVELIHAWLGFVWCAGERRNPLDYEMGIPSAAAVEVLLVAEGLDLTPGMAARSSSPEAIWQAAKWWHLPKEADADLKRRELSGYYNITDVLGSPEQRSSVIHQPQGK